MLSAVSIASPWVGQGVGPAAFVLAGGAVYLIGAASFAKQLRRLSPTVCSYHEVWHLFTVMAATAQLAAMWMLAT